MIETVIKITAASLVLVILFIQAYSDHKTMELYSRLNTAGMVIAAAPVIIFSCRDNYIYILAALAVNLMHLLCRCYAAGDMKLFVMVICMISYKNSGYDILYKYLITLLITVIIFFSYVLLRKIIKKEKLHKKYPYAPAIFISACIGMVI